jgi:hypothetical protein
MKRRDVSLWTHLGHRRTLLVPPLDLTFPVWDQPSQFALSAPPLDRPRVSSLVGAHGSLANAASASATHASAMEVRRRRHSGFILGAMSHCNIYARYRAYEYLHYRHP